MTISPDYGLPQYGLTKDQLKQIERLASMPAWQQRKMQKRMEGSHGRAFIYKYLAFDMTDLSKRKIRDLIVDSKLYLSAPSQFNDPYDFVAHVKVAKNPEVLRKYCLESARRLLDDQGYPVFNVRDRRRKVEEMAKRALEKLISDPDALADTFEKARERNGVACFSEDPRGLLMWAHYAAGHTGICLQFDVTRDPGLLLLSHRVTYHDALPTINWPPLDGEVVDKVILSKGSDWKSEQEVRHVSTIVVRDSLHFDGRALRAIILGARFPVVRLSEVRQLILDRVSQGLPIPTVYQAFRKATAYGVSLRRRVP
jgi:hypothetical protein